jgi:putative tryptophan/tyrosine transport system substrate-binding protein
MIRKIVVATWLLAFLLLPSCTQKQGPRLFTIGIVQITEDALLDEARAGVRASLAESGYVEGKAYAVDYQNAQGEISNITLILKRFVAQRVDLVLTVSTPCMVAAAQLVKDIPVVFTVAFSPQQMGITQTPENMTGAYNPFDMRAFVDLMREVVPGLARIGAPFNSSEPNAVFAIRQLEAECKRRGLDLVSMPIFSSADLLLTSQALSQKGVGAFAIASDNTSYAAMDSLLLVAQRRKIPVFVTDPIMVRRGACAGLGVDYGQWGRESGKLVAAVIAGRKPHDLPLVALRADTPVVNPGAAASQGVTLPLALLARAQIVN